MDKISWYNKWSKDPIKTFQEIENGSDLLKNALIKQTRLDQLLGWVPNRAEKIKEIRKSIEGCESFLDRAKASIATYRRRFDNWFQR